LIDLGLTYEDTPAKSLSLLERAQAQAAADGDARAAALARALAARARLGMLECSPDEQEQAALAALPVLEAAGDHVGLRMVWISLADGVYNFRGQYAQAEHAAEEAVRHSRLAGQRTYPLFLPVALHFGPHPAEDALRRLHELGTDYPHPAIYLRQAVLLAMLGRIDEARALADPNAGTYRGSVVENRVLSQLAEIEELDENYAGADEALRILCENAAEDGQTAQLSTLAPMRGRVLCELGRYEEAQQLAAQGRDLGDPDDAVQQAVWRQVAALVHSHRGEHGEAEHLAREAITVAETTDTIVRIANAHFDLAVVLEAAGRLDEASAAYAAALELYDRKQVIPLARRTRERLAILQ
jgi:tetratricopeptide (TPR) repeat protein